MQVGFAVGFVDVCPRAGPPGSVQRDRTESPSTEQKLFLISPFFEEKEAGSHKWHLSEPFSLAESLIISTPLWACAEHHCLKDKTEILHDFIAEELFIIPSL